MLSWLQAVISWVPVGLPAFVAVIVIVVLVHELGHFLVARACGVGIKVFSIGFAGEIVGWTDRKGTRWKIGWLPLGGYVQFAGDAGAASTPDAEAIAKMTPEERAGAFQLKPLWQRALVVTAGPFANFLLAIVVFSFLFAAFGAKTISTEVGGVAKGTPAAEAGLQTGDKILSVDGRPTRLFFELTAAIRGSGGKPLVLAVKRGPEVVPVKVTPRLIDNRDIYGMPVKTMGLGVSAGPDSPENTVYLPVPLHQAPLAAASQTWRIVDLSLTTIWRMVRQQADSKSLSGPIGIAKVTRTEADAGFYAFASLIAFISVSIGLLNLFPIPLLDGGHLLYYGCEAVLGRPLKEEVQEAGFKVGLALVLGLMIFATLNDLVR
jgi:regulator of sigma E protease